MDAYQRDAGSGYVIKDYGEGLFMLKDSGKGQGRLLFGEVGRVEGVSVYVLVAVLVYKKESLEAPEYVIRAARRRLAEFLEENE